MKFTEEELKGLEDVLNLRGRPEREDIRSMIREIRRLREVERRHDALYAHFADVHAALGEWDDKTRTAADSIRCMREVLAEAMSR